MFHVTQRIKSFLSIKIYIQHSTYNKKEVLFGYGLTMDVSVWHTLFATKYIGIDATHLLRIKDVMLFLQHRWRHAMVLLIFTVALPEIY